MTLSKRLVLHYTRAKFAFLSSISKRKTAEKAFQLFCTPRFRNRKKLPLVFEQAEKLNFTFQKYMIKGYRWNASLVSEKVLILHGFESTAINFASYIEPLIHKGYEVLAFDAPAHGYSSGRQLNVSLYKEFILHIVGQFGPVCTFISHSLGGLALAMALEDMEHDEKFRVVFIAPAVETASAANSLFNLLKLDDGVKKEFDDLIKRKSGGYAHEWFSIARVAPHFKAKILWLQDEDDALTPIKHVVPIMKKNYPQFQFLISKGLGHRRIYRDSRSLKAIMDFLVTDLPA